MRGWIARNFGNKRTVLLHILLILCVVTVSYFNAHSNGYVTDDFGLAVDNPNTKSWGRLGRILTTGYWDAEGGTGGLYRPLTILSFLVEYSIGGLSPVMHHLDNVALHLLCSVLAYLLLKDILDSPRTALYAALLFAAHPVHTEAVTWVSGRAELLSAMFSLGSMLAFIKYRDRAYGMLASGALFALALLSKESGVVVPLMLAAYILLYEPVRPGERRWKQLIRRLWPYVAVFAVFMPIRFAVLGELGPQATEQALFGVSPYDRFLTMCRVLFEYIRLGFFPAELKAAYPFPPPASIMDIRVMVALVTVFLLALFSRLIIRRSRQSFLAASWFLLALLPVSNIIPTGIIMSERAMYLPSLGICMLMAAALAATEGFLRDRTGKSLPYATVLLLPALGLFMAGTIIRNPVWKNQKVFGRVYIAMIRDYIKKYPDDNKLYRHLAATQLRFFKYGPETEKSIREAYRRLGPDDEQVKYMVAFSYLDRDMPERALKEIMSVINNSPPTGSYYFFAAGALSRMKRYDEAAAMIDAAIDLSPNQVKYYMLKGDILNNLGKDDAALKVFEQVTVLSPDNYDAFLRQGVILDSHGKFGPAIEKIKHAVELRPDIADLHYFLAIAYLDAGMPSQAVPELDRALKLKPDYEEAMKLRERLE